MDIFSFFLSEIPVFFLIAGKGRRALLISLTIFLILIVTGFMIGRKRKIRFGFRISYPLTSSVFSLIAAVFFYLRWHTSGRIASAANLLEKPIHQTAILVSLLMALLSLAGIDNLIKILISLFPSVHEPEENRLKERYIIVFIALTAFLTLFLNSKCSPLYPFNDWVDPNTMFTVGKGVLKGYVPYRDLYDQKGPLLYFIQTLGALISYDTFIGIWLIELVFCFFFLYHAYKTAALFFEKKCFIIIPFLAAAVYSPYAFRTGDTAEEFALPLLAYALLTGFQSIKEDRIPTIKEFAIIGLTSGAIFWMKYSMLGFYMGWIIFFLYQAIHQKKVLELIKGCGVVLFCIIMWAIPIFLYFLNNRAVNFMLDGYFFDNFKYYVQNYVLEEKMRIGVWSLSVYFKGPMILTALGLIWMAIRKKFKYLLLTLLSGLFAFFVIYYASVRGPYYCLPLGIYTIFGFCAMIDTATQIPALKNSSYIFVKTISAGALLSGMLILCIFSDNLRFLEYPREEMFQFQMKEIIEKSGIEKPTILYYDIGDAGVNTVAGLIPEIRFFVSYNFENRSDINEEMKRYINEQIPDFIISRTKFDYDYPVFPTYDYQESITGMADQIMQYFHYYTRKGNS